MNRYFVMLWFFVGLCYVIHKEQIDRKYAFQMVELDHWDDESKYFLRMNCCLSQPSDELSDLGEQTMQDLKFTEDRRSVIDARKRKELQECRMLWFMAVGACMSLYFVL